MAQTGVGAAQASTVTISVLNVEGATIPKGTAVSLETTSLRTLDSIEDPVVAVEIFDANAKFIGVAAEDIPADKHGVVVVFGPVLALTGSDIAIGEVVQADAADGSFADYAAGEEHGIALEAGAADGLTLILVNGIGVHGFGGS